MAALGVEEKGAVVVTAAEGWHPGVVGLVAARLKEKFGRPAFAIALEPGGIGTGSGRSIPGVDIGRAVRRAVAEGLLVKGGGHAMAAGVTLRQDGAGAASRLPRSGACRRCRGRAPRQRPSDRRRGERGSGQRRTGGDDRTCRPFGSGNPEPVIALPAHTVVYAERGRPGARAGGSESADGAGVNAIAFRAAGQKLGARAAAQNRGRQVHAAGSFAIDRWQGEERVHFRLTDIAPPSRLLGGEGAIGS